MENELKSFAKERIWLLEQVRRKAEKSVEISNGGNFICRKVRGTFQYYLNGEYVKKSEKDKLRLLAKDRYYKKLLPILNAKIEAGRQAVEFFSDSELEDVYSQMHEGKQVLFTPDFIPIEQRVKMFENEDYAAKTLDEEVTGEYFTANGERVRSKSEIIIADHLRRYSVVYKYEKPLELTVHGRRVTFYPDFTVMNLRTGRIYYLEHFGMMDNEDYYNAVLRKLDAFEMNQLLIGRDVLLLHESSSAPLNTRVLDCYIQEYLV